MATVTIQDENRTLTDVDAINEFLGRFGIWYEKWEVEGRLPADASPDQILETYSPEIERLKQKGGFVTADVIAVSPETPNLDEMMAKFSKEHTHSEDEVRFTIRGSGVFHIHPDDGPVFGVKVESGDLINVPAGIQHWFNLCDDRTIQCIRLFEDPAGWTPHYIDGSDLHETYLPVCMGPQFIPSSDEAIDPVIKP